MPPLVIKGIYFAVSDGHWYLSILHKCPVANPRQPFMSLGIVIRADLQQMYPRAERGLQPLLLFLTSMSPALPCLVIPAVAETLWPKVGQWGKKLQIYCSDHCCSCSWIELKRNSLIWLVHTLNQSDVQLGEAGSASLWSDWIAGRTAGPSDNITLSAKGSETVTFW